MAADVAARYCMGSQGGQNRLPQLSPLLANSKIRPSPPTVAEPRA